MHIHILSLMFLVLAVWFLMLHNGDIGFWFESKIKTHEQWKEEKTTDAENIAKWRKEQTK